MTDDNVDWGEFSRLYRAGAVRFAAGRVGDADRAEDLAQEALAATIVRARDGDVFESREHARNYFFRTLHNLAVSSLRSAERTTSSLDDDVDSVTAVAASEPGAEEQEDRAALTDAIGDLDSLERELLRLRYSEGMTFREISERTGTAISTLQARVESALEKIRRKTGKESGHA